MAARKDKEGSKDGGFRIIARNKKAFRDYHILEKVEAGLVLTGTEVKSLRDGKGSLAEAYARLKGNELFIVKMDIPEYRHGNIMNHEPKRTRKLLLHRREINRIEGKLREKGLTMVPLSLYFRKGYAKIELALAKGKKLYDKREDMKKRDHEKEMRKEISRRKFG